MNVVRFARNSKKFSCYAWGLLLYCLATILWGATVRATGSGDGCGSNWPACGNDGGALIPHGTKIATFIEHTHRFTSELIGLFVVVLVLWGFYAFAKGHPVRKGVLLSLLFMTTEALVGRHLVKHGLVAHNTSPDRAVWMSIHLINTLLLVASLTLTAWWSTHPQPVRRQGSHLTQWALALGLILTLFLAVSGAISALGGTLFPVASLGEGLRQDLSPTSHVLIRLRFWHPFIAVGVYLYSLLLGRLIARERREVPAGSYLGFYRKGLGVLFTAELGIGLLNLLLHAPLAMQLFHLLFADLLWINLVLLTASALSQPNVVRENLSDPAERDTTPVRGVSRAAI